MPVIDITPPKICRAVALPPIPLVPTGISLTLALPTPIIPFPIGVKLCCYTVQFDPSSLIPPLPIVSAAVAIPAAVILNQVISAINFYIRSIGVRCPKGDSI